MTKCFRNTLGCILIMCTQNLPRMKLKYCIIEVLLYYWSAISLVEDPLWRYCCSLHILSCFQTGVGATGILVRELKTGRFRAQSSRCDPYTKVIQTQQPNFVIIKGNEQRLFLASGNANAIYISRKHIHTHLKLDTFAKYLKIASSTMEANGVSIN